MNLNDAQKKSVVEWIAQGLKLSEIQRRINSEFGIVMTYIEVRFLVDDLKALLEKVQRAGYETDTSQPPLDGYKRRSPAKLFTAYGMVITK